MLQVRRASIRTYSIFNRVKTIFNNEKPKIEDEITKEEVEAFDMESLRTPSLAETILDETAPISLDHPLDIRDFSEYVSAEFTAQLENSKIISRSKVFLPLQTKALLLYVEEFYKRNRHGASSIKNENFQFLVQGETNSGKSSLGVILCALESFLNNKDAPLDQPHIAVYSPNVETLCYYDYHISTWPSNRPIEIEKHLQKLEYDVQFSGKREALEMEDLPEDYDYYEFARNLGFEDGETTLGKKVVINEEKFKKLTTPPPEKPIFYKRKDRKAYYENLKRQSETYHEEEAKKEEDITHQYEEEEIYQYENTVKRSDVLLTNQLEAIPHGVELLIIDDLCNADLASVKARVDEITRETKKPTKVIFLNNEEMDASILLGEHERKVRVTKERYIDDKAINHRHSLSNFNVEEEEEELESSVKAMVYKDSTDNQKDLSTIMMNGVYKYEPKELLELITRKLVRDVLVRDLFQTVIYCPNEEIVEMMYRYFSSLLLATDIEVIGLHPCDTSEEQYNRILDSFKNVLSSRLFVTSDKFRALNLPFSHVIHIGPCEDKVSFVLKMNKPKLNGVFSKRMNNLSVFATEEELKNWKLLNIEKLDDLPELTADQKERVEIALGIFGDVKPQWKSMVES
jgi:hypothetical protein